MPSDKKRKNEKEKNPQTKPNKVTSEDVPGNGMAKRAARAIEDRQKRRKELLDSL